MKVQIQRLVNILMVLFSWFSIPFLGWSNIKRFVPSAILVFLICCIDVQVGKKRRWWSFYNKPQSFVTNELPFLLGPFIAGSLWTLRFTYGHFKTFIGVNAIIEIIFASAMTRFLSKMKMYRLVRLNEVQFFFFFFYKALILYGIQCFFDDKKKVEQRF